jgi:hypothetical protein
MLTGNRFRLKSEETLMVIFFFIIISIIFTYPLIWNMNGVLDLKEDNRSTAKQGDVLLFTNALDDARESIKKDPFSLKYYAPADPSITYLIFGMLITGVFTVSDIFAHNLIFIISMILSGAFMYALACRFTKNKYASLFAGFLYCTSNYLFSETVWGHANLMQIQWIPIIFLFLDRILIEKKNKIIDATLFGLFFGIQAMACAQYTTYLTFMLPLYAIVRLYFSDNFHFKTMINRAAYLFVSGIVSFIIAGFFIIHRLGVPAPTRTLQDNTLWFWRLVSLDSLVDPDHSLSLGLIPVLFLIIGVYLILTQRKKEYYPWIILFFVGLLLILGPISKYTLYYWFYNFWPFVDKFRVPARLLPFLLISTYIINAAVYAHLQKKLKIKDGLLFFIVMVLLIILTQSIWSRYVIEHYITYL